MIKYKKSDFVDIDKCESRLRRDGYICYDRDRLSHLAPYYRAHADTCANLARDLMRFKSGGQYGLLKRECIASYLQEYEHCPASYFRKKGVNGPSIEMKSVLCKLYANGYAKEFFELYFEHRTWDNKSSKLSKIFDECWESAGKNKNGAELCKIPFQVNRQKNLRFNYNNYDIIAQIPKACSDCISVEDGYFLAWGDFAQSDFRIAYNLFLRSPENDKIMSQYKDKYEALARIVAITNGTIFDLDKFKEDRQLYKTLTLKTIYGTNDSVVQEERAFIHTFTNFLNKCPGYCEYRKRLKRRIELNLPIILTSYFGNEEQINVYGTYESHILDDALNSPVQTGTSEIIILTINSILDRFYSMGFTEDDIRIYYNRHDEPIFRVKETLIDYLWVFKDYEEILVDDWSPLKLDFSFGYYYKVEDQKLMKLFEETTLKYDNKIAVLHPEKWTKGEYYYPAADVFILFVHRIKVSDKTVVTFYSADLNQVLYSLFHTVDDREIEKEIKCKVRDAEAKIYNNGYRGIVVRSAFINGEDFFGKSFIHYTMYYGNELINVCKLCNIMVSKYCRKYNLECTVDSVQFTQYDDWYYSLGELEFLKE